MKLTELLPRKAVVVNLKAKDKKGAIRELVQVIKTAHDPEKFAVQPVVDATLQREGLGSTGMGGGIAIPHARTETADRVVAAFGRHVKGLDWSASDGEPVHLVFMLVSPASQPAEYQRAVKSILDAVRRPNFCKFLLSANTVKDIEETFREAEEVVRVP